MFKEITTKISRQLFSKGSPRVLILLLGFVVFSFSHGDDSTNVEKLSVVGKKEVLPTRPGSAHVISEKELQKFKYNDIHQVLRSVPGVNVQEEDGFGLRPNIGLRGGHPHRSRKVTLMEDGILIAPAPYSAPAAYYFPQMSKIGSVEVFKGVPSTAFGPNSIGGAMNLVTRMNTPGLKLGILHGNYGSSQYNLSSGIEAFGDWSFDYNHTETDGFKKLRNKDNTGFVRRNFTVRWDKYLSSKEQNINFKFNWSDEKSNETYAGLTDSDFASNPYQRYTATENDKMTWTHRQFFLSYAISPAEDLRTRITVYNHGFDRSWDKLIGFTGTNPGNQAPEISEILNNPDLAANNYFYQVLRGDADSGVLSDGRDVLDLGNNQRQYYSRGVQTQLEYELLDFSWSHLFKLNYRFHQDGIQRFHESQFYNMTGGSLALNNTRAQTTTLLNEASADAHTVALTHETSYERLTAQTILRIEKIDYEQTDKLTSQVIESDDDIFAPGFGLFHQTFSNTGFLLGVNKGFTPVGPGQASNVDPEEAINYEFGIRHSGKVGAELIGFYSDYKNLLGTCTQSGGCTVNQLDQSFNGGKAEVIGAEFMLRTNFKTKTANFPLRLGATYTEATFKNNFTSALNEWGVGNVQSGDPIPYIPDVQANLLTGFEVGNFSTYFNANYLGKMADQAVAAGRRTIDSRFVLGASFGYKISAGQFRLRLDNVTDEKYAVSRRPFGLRPGRPFMFLVGFESELF